jgi:hypothetical protein
MYAWNRTWSGCAVTKLPLDPHVALPVDDVASTESRSGAHARMEEPPLGTFAAHVGRLPKHTAPLLLVVHIAPVNAMTHTVCWARQAAGRATRATRRERSFIVGWVNSSTASLPDGVGNEIPGFLCNS